MGSEAKACGQLQDAGKSKETDFPLEPPEGIQPDQHLRLRTSDLQHCKAIDLWCFEPQYS